MASEEMDRLIAHLKRLKLSHAAQSIAEHLQQAAQLKLSGLALLARVMEAEVIARNERAAGLRISQAEFPEICRLETYDFKKQPCLNRSLVLDDLATLSFVDKKQAVFWIGPSGVGKTHLAIGLGVKACQSGYHVRFFRAYKLLTRLYASLADDTFELLLDELCRPDLLIIDELGNSPRKPEQDFAGVFFELAARRHRRGSIVLTTNLGFDQWPEALGSPFQVTPTIDRLLEAAYVITFPKDAPSYRVTRTEPPPPLPPLRRRRHSTTAQSTLAPRRAR
jgi:DNA replication protein DnaC